MECNEKTYGLKDLWDFETSEVNKKPSFITRKRSQTFIQAEKYAKAFYKRPHCFLLTDEYNKVFYRQQKT